MKKTIKLKEGDITRMVMEAVNELDWRTHRNAAKKRKEQGKEYKSKLLYDYSNEMLANQNGIGANSEFSTSEHPSWVSFHEPGDYSGNCVNYYSYNPNEDNQFDDGFDTINRAPEHWDVTDFRKSQKMPPEMLAKANNALYMRDEFDKGNFEYGHFKHYPFQKGWHRKELTVSPDELERRLHESVNKTLRKYLK